MTDTNLSRIKIILITCVIQALLLFTCTPSQHKPTPSNNETGEKSEPSHPITHKYPVIPPVKSITATIDTVKGTVLLQWTTDYMDLKDFLVYRMTRSSIEFVKPYKTIRETSFIDTLISLHPRNKKIVFTNDTNVHPCYYFVKIRDHKKKTGIVGDTLRVDMVSPRWIATDFSVSLPHTYDTVSINDTVKCSAIFRNRGRKIKQVVWTDGKASTVHPSGTHSGTDTFSTAWNDTGDHKIFVKVEDDAGRAVKESCNVRVILDKPSISIKSVKSTGLNDPIRIQASAHQRFGRIETWQWDPGCAGTYYKGTRADTTLIAPSQPVGDYRIAVRAIDDDGNRDDDTVHVHVKSLPPKVSLITDSSTGLFDKLRLHAACSDNGTISKIEWDVGCTGKFNTSSDDDTMIGPFHEPGKHCCALLVTDDDGEQARDSCTINSMLLWEKIAGKSVVPERNGNTFLSFKKRIWIIAGARNDVWSSVDLKEWNMETGSAPFGSLYGHSSVVFDNKLWVIGGKLANGGLPGEIWSSPDGQNWQKNTSHPFLQRHYQASTVFKNRIWIVGGLGDAGNEPCFQDVWSSADGSKWDLMTETPGFRSRYGHGLVVHNGRMWVIAGYYDGLQGSASMRDAWVTADGRKWDNVTESAGFSRDRFHSFVVYDNRIWAIGGYSKKITGFSDVWSTSDGTEWKHMSGEDKSAGKFYNTAVVFDNRIWLHPGDTREYWYMR